MLKNLIMEENKLFKSLADEQEEMRQGFYSLVLSMIKKVGSRGVGKFVGPTGKENYEVPVNNFPSEQDNRLREILFSINFDIGHIRVTFTSEVNNQNALWCVQGGAHVAQFALVFTKFTQKTKEGLETIVRRYLNGDKKVLLELFTFEEEKVLA